MIITRNVQFYTEEMLYFLIICNPLSFLINPYLSLGNPHPLKNGEERNGFFIGNFPVFQTGIISYSL